MRRSSLSHLFLNWTWKFTQTWQWFVQVLYIFAACALSLILWGSTRSQRCFDLTANVKALTTKFSWGWRRCHSFCMYYWTNNKKCKIKKLLYKEYSSSFPLHYTIVIVMIDRLKLMQQKYIYIYIFYSADSSSSSKPGLYTTPRFYFYFRLQPQPALPPVNRLPKKFANKANAMSRRVKESRGKFSDLPVYYSAYWLANRQTAMKTSLVEATINNSSMRTTWTGGH